MDILLDNKETENRFREILRLVRLHRNGDVAEAMKNNGIQYKMNWGVSIVDLRSIAMQFVPDHLLALKLWNKQWRETMILAAMMDEPAEVTEEQMDFWTKSLPTAEMAEQVSSNLWARTRFSFVKAIEWCRGKKHLVRFCGVHLMGRLALADNKMIDEMFEPFFDELIPPAKDPKLYTVIYRSVIALGSRSSGLNQQATELSRQFQLSDSENAVKLGESLFDVLTDPGISERFLI